MLFFLLFLFQDPTVARVDIETFKNKFDQKNTTVLDVRTEKEYKEGHLEGAVLIDFYGESFKAEIEKLPKDKPYLLYCRSGGRSMKTLNLMKEMGFKNVSEMEGGFLAWSEKGFPSKK